MAIELSGKDLGIANCDWSASGETPADVLEQMVKHLRKEHDIDMPSAQAIMEGRVADNPLLEDVDERVALIIQRIHAELDMPAPEEEPEARPVLGPVTTR